MVIALLVLALAMIAGGAYAMIEGWLIVVLEAGWAQLIAGAAITAGGAVLLGITAAVRRLGQVRTELVRLRERMGRAEPAFPEPPRMDPVAAVSSGLLARGAAGGPAPALDPLPPVTNPVEAPLGAPALGDELLPEAPTNTPAARPGLPAAGLVGSVKTGEAPQRVEPPVSWPVAASAPAPVGGSERDEPVRPAISVADEPATSPAEAARPSQNDEEDAPFASADPVVPDTPAAEPLRLAEGESSGDEPAPKTDTPEASASGEGVTVIGTYTSGGNRYVMFSDGSIDAETPDGTFRFQSLDELKAFIASGGEGPRES
jgi:hypothetical protein